MKFDPRVSIEALASSHSERQSGTWEIVCDEEFFDLVFEELGNPAASCPQFDEIVGLRTDAVQYNPPGLWWEGRLKSCAPFICHWFLTTRDRLVWDLEPRMRRIAAKVGCCQGVRYDLFLHSGVEGNNSEPGANTKYTLIYRCIRATARHWNGTILSLPCPSYRLPRGFLCEHYIFVECKILAASLQCSLTYWCGDAVGVLILECIIE